MIRQILSADHPAADRSAAPELSQQKQVLSHYEVKEASDKLLGFIRSSQE
jgi:hypothetical protein